MSTPQNCQCRQKQKKTKISEIITVNRTKETDKMLHGVIE